MNLQEKILEIKQTRASSQPLPTGAAPYTSAKHFKIQPSPNLPSARRWDSHFSDVAFEQSGSVLKTAAAAKGPDDMITLGTGRPAAEFYPWTMLAMRTGSEQHENFDTTSTAGEAAFDLAVALNYGYSAGSPHLLRFITEHVEFTHDPPYADWDCAITAGTTSAIDLTLQILCDPGNHVLIEEYTYPGTIDALKSQGLNKMAVKMDKEGLVPTELDAQLRHWDATKGKKPSVLYMIPTGHNPTGITQPLERRKAIYAVAEAHNLLIIEDDPYMFLQLRPELNAAYTHRNLTPEDRYLAGLPTSCLSLDTSGRIIRLDSTSKILAPGLRCGWITASSQVIAKFLARMEVSVVSANGVSQVMLYKLLDESWGHDGFVRWLISLSERYNQRLRILAEACTKYLPTDHCDWNTPTEGMFLWVRVSLRAQCTHEGSSASATNGEDRIYSQSKANGVLVSKGSWFGAPAMPDGIYFRLTFAAAEDTALELAVRRFADAVCAVAPTDTCTSPFFGHENSDTSASGVIKNGCSDKFNQNAGSKS